MKFYRARLAHIGLVCVAWACLTPARAAADTVTLINDDHITGTVTIIANGNAVVKTETMGTLSIPVASIKSITKDAPIIVETGGTEITGVLTAADGTQQIQTDTGLRPVTLADVSQAYEQRLGAPDLQTSWTSRVDLGYVISKGNTDTETASLHAESMITRRAFEHRVHAFVDRDEADDVKTQDTLDAGYALRWYFREPWYGFGNVNYFQDKLKDIDRRVTVGAGLGYKFWDNALSRLTSEIGISQVFEKLDGESENNPAIRWGLDYTYWLIPEQADFFYTHELLKILDSDRGEVLKASSGLRWHLNANWNAMARVDLNHETEPPPGAHKSDLTYVLGVGIIF